jgi:capsid protein
MFKQGDPSQNGLSWLWSTLESFVAPAIMAELREGHRIQTRLYGYHRRLEQARKDHRMAVRAVEANGERLYTRTRTSLYTINFYAERIASLEAKIKEAQDAAGSDSPA